MRTPTSATRWPPRSRGSTIRSSSSREGSMSARAAWRSTARSSTGSRASGSRSSGSTPCCPRRSFAPSPDRPNQELLAHPLLHPGAELLDLIRGPGAVAGHVAVLEPLEDRGCVLLHVLVPPQVECPLHPGPVLVAEQRPDVLLVAQRHVVSPLRVGPGRSRTIRPSTPLGPAAWPPGPGPPGPGHRTGSRGTGSP